MTTPARKRAERTGSRALLLDATEHVMVSEGYAAVTVRRVAAKVGLTPAIVHYYFPTMDELLLATYRRAVGRWDDLVSQALASDRPLHALWNLNVDVQLSTIGTEFLAMANHRKSIRTEIARHERSSRRMQTDALQHVLAAGGFDLKAFPPSSVAMFFSAMGRAFVTEEAFGDTTGHPEMRALIERWLEHAERGRRAPRKTDRSAPSPAGE